MNDQGLKERIFHFGAFARTMHNGKLAEMIRQCSAKQIYDFHNAYAASTGFPTGALISPETGTRCWNCQHI